MKFLSPFFLLYIFLISYQGIAGQLPTQDQILTNSNYCFRGIQDRLCEELILQMEEIQYIKFQNNEFKCQSSILGLQTELIEAFYLKRIKKNKNSIMQPYVIKNC